MRTSRRSARCSAARRCQAAVRLPGGDRGSQGFLKTAVAFEDLAVEAYKGQAPRLQSKQVLAAALGIHTVEARHAAWMRYLNGIRPAASAFDDPRKKAEIDRIVRATGFVTAKPVMTARRAPTTRGELWRAPAVVLAGAVVAGGVSAGVATSGPAGSAGRRARCRPRRGPRSRSPGPGASRRAPPDPLGPAAARGHGSRRAGGDRRGGDAARFPYAGGHSASTAGDRQARRRPRADLAARAPAGPPERDDRMGSAPRAGRLWARPAPARDRPQAIEGDAARAGSSDLPRGYRDGQDRWPTPRGEFLVRNRLERYRSPRYGPVAFGTSARSPTLTDWPAGGFVGIHGTDRPDILPGRVSHGCIRMRNADILRLARLLPVGTTVTIR